MTKDLILAIDNGTQSVRALVFDLQGNLLAKSRVPLQAYFSTQPGWAEQDPEYFWEQLCQACQGLWAQGTVDKEAIAGVALTTQRSTVINLDKRRPAAAPGHCLAGPAPHRWAAKPVGGLWGLAFPPDRHERDGRLPAGRSRGQLAAQAPAGDLGADAQIPAPVRLPDLSPDRALCRLGGLPGGLHALRLQGAALGGQARLEMAGACRMDAADLLAELVPPAARWARSRPRPPRQTGIPAGLPLIAAAADKACEVIGSGCLEPHIGCLSYGTTATINTTHRHTSSPSRCIPPYPAAVPGAYSMEVADLSRLLDGQLVQAGVRSPRTCGLPSERGIEPEALFDELVDQVPPGSMGLMLQPYWSPGLEVPGPEAKGAIIGFGDVHTRAHLYRAILEGLAYALREGKERQEKRTAHARSPSLRVSGGGSQSDAAMQLTADIFGLPAARPAPVRDRRSGRGDRCGGWVGVSPRLPPGGAGHDPRGTRLRTEP